MSRLSHPDIERYTRYERDLDCDCTMLLRDGKDIIESDEILTEEQENDLLNLGMMILQKVKKI